MIASRSSRNFRNSLFFTTLALLVVLISGCEQAREKMADLIRPKTMESVTSSVNEQIAQGKFKLAQREGEEFLGGKEDVTGQLAWSLAKASAQLGEVDPALKYLGQALKAKAVTGPQAMVEPQLEGLRTELRFVALLVGVSMNQSPAAKPDATVGESGKSSTSINMGSGGTEVKAGDITIKLSN